MGLEKYEPVLYSDGAGVIQPGFTENVCGSCAAYEDCDKWNDKYGWDGTRPNPYERMCEQTGVNGCWILKLKADLPFEVRIGDKVCEPALATDLEIDIPSPQFSVNTDRHSLELWDGDEIVHRVSYDDESLKQWLIEQYIKEKN